MTGRVVEIADFGMDGRRKRQKILTCCRQNLSRKKSLKYQEDAGVTTLSHPPVTKARYRRHKNPATVYWGAGSATESLNCRFEAIFWSAWMPLAD